MALLRNFAFALLVTIAIPGHAATRESALEATRRGDYAAAYPLWVALAEAGDDTAMVEVGLMHHRGQGVPVDHSSAMSWYLKAFRKNGDAINNIGVMHRDGLGVPVNRRISYLLFLLVHMEGIGGQSTVSRANRNLRREIAEVPRKEQQQATCYTMHYLVAYVESRGQLQGVPEHLRASVDRKRIRELSWWLPGELENFECDPGT